MKKKLFFVKRPLLFLVLTAVLVPFQNCSPLKSNLIENSTTLSSTSPDTENAAGRLERLSSAKAVLQSRCTSCHYEGSGPGRIVYDTDQEFINARLVTPGSLSASKLILRLRNYTGSVEGRTMPPAGNLPDSEYQILTSWVENIQIPPSSVATNAFTCNSTEDPELLNAKRLSKNEVFNTLRGLLVRPFGSAEADQMITTDSQFFSNRVPNDSKTPFARGDSNFSALHSQAFFDVANEIANLITSNARYSRFVTTYINYNSAGCTLADVNNLSAGCRDAFIRNFLLRAWGRPADSTSANLNNEFAAYVAEYNLATSSMASVNNVIFRALISPQFLFQIYPDVTTVAGTTVRLSSYAIARRLSFSFMQSNLDEELIRLASTSDLSTDVGFSQALNYVSSRARSTVSEFTDEWLKLYSLPNIINLNTAKFQAIAQGITVNDNLKLAMRNEVIELVNYLDQSGRSAKELLTTNISFARDQNLMRIYGQTSAAPAVVTEQNAIRFLNGQRNGIPARAAMLFAGTHTERPIMRGVHFRQQFLCMDVRGTIPPGASTTALPTDTNLTTREKVHQITSATTCVGCHSQINPVGFAYSQYNALGAFQAAEPIYNSNMQFVQNLNTDPIVNWLTSIGVPRETRSVAEFHEIAAESQDFKKCVSQYYYTYLNSMDDKTNSINSCSMNRMYDVINQGGSLRDFFKAGAQDPKFRQRNLIR